jgi:hypothetical protein
MRNNYVHARNTNWRIVLAFAVELQQLQNEFIIKVNLYLGQYGN